MPLLYGEGRKAFGRLQKEILKTSTDQSIFAWEHEERYGGHTKVKDKADHEYRPPARMSIFAPGPYAFQAHRLHEVQHYMGTSFISLTDGGGVGMEAMVGRCRLKCKRSTAFPRGHAMCALWFAGLNCLVGRNPLAFAVILLREVPLRPGTARPGTFVRVRVGSRCVWEVDETWKAFPWLDDDHPTISNRPAGKYIQSH